MPPGFQNALLKLCLQQEATVTIGHRKRDRALLSVTLVLQCKQKLLLVLFALTNT